jgi:hypothetical protein
MTVTCRDAMPALFGVEMSSFFRMTTHATVPFKKIDGPVTLKSGDVLLIGKQLFRFEVLGS